VTIDASDSLGNPLGQSSGLALAGSLTPSDSFGAGALTSSNMLASDGSTASDLTLGSILGSHTLGGSAAAVPEPTTLLLALLGLVSLGCVPRRIRR
jgi:hypothetical protein